MKTNRKPARPSLAEACARYVHRYTMEHVPAWAQKRAENGLFYAPQYRNDAEWYERTLFYGEPGHYGTKNECCSAGQSWPLGQWLDAQFVNT